jgi:tetratricopeptide (TPR) repeat protein
MSSKPKSINRNNPKISELSSSRKKFFILVTILLPIIILVLLEIGLRIFHYGNDTRLFVSIPDESSKFYGINLQVAKRFFTKLSDVPMPRKDLFLKEKPKNGYRIFVLGESSAAGFPYGNNVTFTRILNRRLSDAFPDKYIEVVNTGMTAINTYAQLDFMDEILQQKPDAILIYTGHNEYYGALGVESMESLGKNRWTVKTILKLQKFKIYTLVQNLVTSIKGLFGSGDSEENNNDVSSTLMQRIVKGQLIPLNSEDYELGKNQFRENLNEIISKAKDAGVKVLISELVSNIRDNKPFESIKVNSLPAAQDEFNKAVELENQGNFEEARKAFYYAKDLDALRFRAPEEFNNIIHEVAKVYSIPVVPMKSYFEAHSPNGIIGKKLMLEHLHPNIDGYFLMADAFFNTMQKEKFISNYWQENNIKPLSFYRKNWGFSTLDSVYAYLAVRQLMGGWPFQKNKGPNVALGNYKPSNKTDSIARDILLTGALTLEQGHIELADYYERKGELDLAFKECNALIYTVPYLDLFYEPTVKILVQMKNYKRALEVLFELLKYQQTAFAYQWIGQIYLISDETEKGIPFMNKAKEMDPRNEILLFNLCRANYKIFNFEQGDLVFNQFQSIASDPSALANLEGFRKAMYDEFMNLKEKSKSTKSIYYGNN